MTKKRMIQEVRRAIKETNKYRPFSKNGKGDPEKDYYRGQSDALLWFLEELLEVDTGGFVLWEGTPEDLKKGKGWKIKRT